MSYRVEHTDTFGGEANYCWVRRYDIPDRKKGWTRRALVRKTKALTGLTRHRCETFDAGDMIEIRPRRMAQVIFITWKEDL